MIIACNAEVEDAPPAVCVVDGDVVVVVGVGWLLGVVEVLLPPVEVGALLPPEDVEPELLVEVVPVVPPPVVPPPEVPPDAAALKVYEVLVSVPFQTLVPDVLSISEPLVICTCALPEPMTLNVTVATV